MSDVPRFNQGSSATATITWLGLDGAPADPASIEYRIDCLSTGAAIRAKTTLAIGAPLELEPSDTRIVGDGSKIEQRAITAKATWSGGQTVKVFRYEVQPVKHYPL